MVTMSTSTVRWAYETTAVFTLKTLFRGLLITGFATIVRAIIIILFIVIYIVTIASLLIQTQKLLAWCSHRYTFSLSLFYASSDNLHAHQMQRERNNKQEPMPNISLNYTWKTSTLSVTLKGTRTPQNSQNLKYQGINRNWRIGRAWEVCYWRGNSEKLAKTSINIPWELLSVQGPQSLIVKSSSLAAHRAQSEEDLH